MSDRSWGFATRAVHAGGGPDPTIGARAVPIYQSSSSVFEDTADPSSLFALQKYETIHSRILDTTVAAFKERDGQPGGGLPAVATSSPQAAPFLTFAAVTGASDHIVASANLYRGTVTQLNVTPRRFAVGKGPERRGIAVLARRPRLTSPPRPPRWALTRAKTAPEAGWDRCDLRRPRARRVHRSVQSRLGTIGELLCM